MFDHFTSREEVVHLETSLVFEHRFSRSLPCFPMPESPSSMARVKVRRWPDLPPAAAGTGGSGPAGPLHEING